MSGEIRWAPFGSSEAEELLLGGYRVSVIATWPWLGHEFVMLMLGAGKHTVVVGYSAHEKKQQRRCDNTLTHLKLEYMASSIGDVHIHAHR